MPIDIDDARAVLGDARRYDAAGVHERIKVLARPRLSGTEGAEEIEAALRERFEELGYQTEELGFSFSTWPGRFGLTLSGALLLITGIAGTLTLRAGLPIVALAVLIGGMALVLAPLLLLDGAIRRLPLGRVETHNLLFTLADSAPAWIIMAHRDSKSQLAPTLVRTGAVIAGAVGWLVLVVLSGLWFAGELFRFPTLTLIAGLIVTLAGLALALSWAGNRSPGALDNASGLAALLAVAGDSPADVGFVLTDGEELGLAGARAVARQLSPVQGVINLEGLDDDGTLMVAEGHGWRRRGSAPQLAAALLTAGRALDIDVHRRPLPLSIPVDHLPVAAEGIPALTVFRGRWRSLLRVHSSGDTADRLDGRGAAEGATLLAAALRLLRETEGEHRARRRGSRA